MKSSHNIARVLSKIGVCSRKQAVEYVQAGRVKINGKKVFDPGTPAGAGDRILVDGKPPVKTEKLYIMFHKPAGCVTTRKDELGRQTVYDYLGDMGQWIFPVGRLDLESEGLLLFTNDTDFGNRLTDPRYKVPRTYNVTLDSPLPPEDFGLIRRGGISLGRGETAGPAELSRLKEDESGNTIRITLIEGKNRELRRLFEALGRKVTRLLRTDFGGFSLGNIPCGRWRSWDGPLPGQTAKPEPDSKPAQDRKGGPARRGKFQRRAAKPRNGKRR
ncbi:MAG: pseudouridine synthase [Elusimicrobiaceae bacterium]